MKVGLVISQTDPETVWNALDLLIFSIDKGHSVRTFLIGKGVESVEIDHEEFNVIEEVNKYVDNKGEISMLVEHALYRAIRKEAKYALCLL